jgi:hypothetical protein
MSATLLKVVSAIPHKRRGSGRSDLGPLEAVGRVGIDGKASEHLIP